MVRTDPERLKIVKKATLIMITVKSAYDRSKNKSLFFYLVGDLVDRHFPHDTSFNNECGLALLVLTFNLVAYNFKVSIFSITHNQKVLSFTEDIEGFDVTLRRVPLEDFQHNKLLDLGSSLLSEKKVNIFT